MFAQAIFETTDLGRAHIAACAGAARAGLLALRLRGLAHPPLHFAHGQSLRDDLAREVGDTGFITHAEEGARMADGELTIPHEPTHGGWQQQQAQRVGDRRSILADNIRDFLLRERELLDELLVAFRFFDRIEIRALQILDHRE